jgi:hypothetical protein
VTSANVDARQKFQRQQQRRLDHVARFVTLRVSGSSSSRCRPCGQCSRLHPAPRSTFRFGSTEAQKFRVGFCVAGRIAVSRTQPKAETNAQEIHQEEARRKRRANAKTEKEEKANACSGENAKEIDVTETIGNARCPSSHPDATWHGGSKSRTPSGPETDRFK